MLEGKPMLKSATEAWVIAHSDKMPKVLGFRITIRDLKNNLMLASFVLYLTVIEIS